MRECYGADRCACDRCLVRYDSALRGHRARQRMLAVRAERAAGSAHPPKPTRHPHPLAEADAGEDSAAQEQQELELCPIGRGVCGDAGSQAAAPPAAPTAAAEPQDAASEQQSNTADPPPAPRRTSRRGPTGGVFPGKRAADAGEVLLPPVAPFPLGRYSHVVAAWPVLYTSCQWDRCSRPADCLCTCCPPLPVWLCAEHAWEWHARWSVPPVGWPVRMQWMPDDGGY